MTTEYSEELSEHSKHFAFYAQIIGEINSMRRMLVDHNRVVDEWASSNVGELETVVTPHKDWHGSVVITSILATWPITSTSAVLQLGDRTFVFPPALGYVNISGLKLQLEYADDRIFTVAPAGVCAIELCGYADLPVVGRRGGQRG